MRALTQTLIALACTGATLASAQDACPTRAWPVGDWTSIADQVSTERTAEIAALEDFAFTLQGDDADREGARTDGVVIIRVTPGTGGPPTGQIVYEKYARGWTAERKHLTWSVSKSFTNALTGIAVGRGALTLGDSICTHLGQGNLGPVCDLTVQHLLEFGSGLDWKETYEGQSNQASSVLAMLYGVGRRHMARFVWSHPFRDAPGTSWAYSSGDTTLLMHVVGKALQNHDGSLTDNYPWSLLFNRLGMRSAAFERDAAGTYVGSSYVYATPRDLARFGYFLLTDGCWQNQRILPQGWLAASVVPSGPFLSKRLYWEEGDVQGRQFWLNRPVPELGFPIPWPDVPEDAYAARGHWGQSITVIPSLDLVIVRVADDRDGTFDFNRFVSLAIGVGRP